MKYQQIELAISALENILWYQIIIISKLTFIIRKKMYLMGKVTPGIFCLEWIIILSLFVLPPNPGITVWDSSFGVNTYLVEVTYRWRDLFLFNTNTIKPSTWGIYTKLVLNRYTNVGLCEMKFEFTIQSSTTLLEIGISITAATFIRKWETSAMRWKGQHCHFVPLLPIGSSQWDFEWRCSIDYHSRCLSLIEITFILMNTPLLLFKPHLLIYAFLHPMEGDHVSKLDTDPPMRKRWRDSVFDLRYTTNLCYEQRRWECL